MLITSFFSFANYTAEFGASRRLNNDSFAKLKKAVSESDRAALNKLLLSESCRQGVAGSDLVCFVKDEHMLPPLIEHGANFNVSLDRFLRSDVRAKALKHVLKTQQELVVVDELTVEECCQGITCSGLAALSSSPAYALTSLRYENLLEHSQLKKMQYLLVYAGKDREQDMRDACALLKQQSKSESNRKEKEKRKILSGMIKAKLNGEESYVYKCSGAKRLAFVLVDNKIVQKFIKAGKSIKKTLQKHPKATRRVKRGLKGVAMVAATAVVL